MKVVLFSHVCYPFTNGVAVSVEQLANVLKSHNHDVTIVSNNYDKFSNDFSKDGNIEVLSIPIFYQNLRTPVLINPQLIKELVKRNYDVAHSHSDFGLAMLARAYAKTNHKPLIQTYHCDYLNYARSNFGKLSKPAFYIPVKYYSKMICDTADRVIVPSLETKRLLEEDFKINKQLDYIPNGIDLSKFGAESSKVSELKEKYNIHEDDFVLVSVSRLSREKEIDNILTILPFLRDCEKLKLLIVGGGPDEKRLKKIASELHLDNVIFTGEIPFKQVQDYYRLGNMFISNSQAETQGLSIIEALSSSIPAICPNIPIYQELIRSNENGFLFDDYVELINIIRKCYRNQEALSPMGKNARDKATQFSLNKSVSKIENIYEEEKNKVRKRRDT